MKSIFSQHTLSSSASIEHNLFGDAIKAIAATTIAFGCIGGLFAAQSKAIEPDELMVAVTPHVEFSASSGDLVGVVVPECYYPENPIICFTSVGGATPGEDSINSGAAVLEPGTTRAVVKPTVKFFSPDMLFRLQSAGQTTS